MPITFFPDPTYLTYEDVNSPGELDLLKKFYECKDYADWTIIYSLHLKDHIVQSLGEADMVIAIPSVGFLVVEVKHHKNGSFNNITGDWKLGQDEPTKKSPFLQLEENRISFQKKIKETFPTLKKVFCWELLVFTRIKKIDSQFEFNREDYVNYDDFKLEGKEFLDLFTKRLVKQKDLSKPSLSFIDPNAPDRSQINLFNQIRKSIEFEMSPNMRKEILTKDLKKVFTQHQLYVYNHMKNNSQLLIEGPSGTGKTLLAIEAAKQANENKRRSLFLCFNALLGDHLKRELSEFEHIEAFTKLEFFKKLIGDKGKIEKDENLYFKNLTKLVLEWLIKNENEFSKFDQIILDEAQDILDEETIDIFDLILKGGIKNGRFAFFGDFDFQNVQNRELINIEKFKKNYKPVFTTLNENCRNMPDMIATAKFYCKYDPYSRVLRHDEDSDPIIEGYDNDTDLLKKLERVLEILISQKFKFDEITVLTFKSRDKSIFKDYKSEKFNNFNLIKKINVKTIREFKGMENNAIVIVELEKLETEIDRQLLHIAMTRPLEKLCLLYMNSFKPI